MKKIAFFLFLLFALSTFSNAQSKNSVGFFAGLNIPRLSGGNDNELSRDYTSRAGGAFGLKCSIYLGHNFALRVDAMYSSEGGKRNGIQAFEASSINPLAPIGSYYYAVYKNESILNYIEVPVILKYLFPLNLSSKFYVGFGPFVGFLLNAKQKTSGSSEIYADRSKTATIIPVAQSFDANTDITSSINHLNFGFTGGGGYSQKMNSGEVFVDVRGAYGLKVIQKYSQNGSSHNGNLLIDVGYAFYF